VAISFVQSATAGASPNTQVSIPLTTPSSGDLILVAFGVGDSPGANNDLALAGYTEVVDLAETGDTNDTELWVGYKYSDGTETSIGPFTALGGSNASNVAVAMVFRGVAQAADGGPFDTAASSTTGTGSSDANPPSHNWSGAAGVWTVIAAASAHTGAASALWTFPSGYTTDAAQRAHNDTIDVMVGMGYNSSPADPEDPGVMTASTIGVAADNSWAAATMSLKPAPAGGATEDPFPYIGGGYFPTEG
jgi:hypothetical protein